MLLWLGVPEAQTKASGHPAFDRWAGCTRPLLKSTAIQHKRQHMAEVKLTHPSSRAGGEIVLP